MTYRRVIKEQSIVIGHDLVTDLACSLSHKLPIISYPFVTSNYLFELFEKLGFPIIFQNL